MQNHGELVPVGNGDPIQLLKRELVIGRREDCDIVLRIDNIPAVYCQLTMQDGSWHARSQNSKDGILVNGKKVVECQLEPGDTLGFGDREFQIQYSRANL